MDKMSTKSKMSHPCFEAGMEKYKPERKVLEKQTPFQALSVDFRARLRRLFNACFEMSKSRAAIV